MNLPGIDEGSRVDYQRLFFNLLVEYSSLLSEGGILLTQIPYKLIRNKYLGGGEWQMDFRKAYEDMLSNFCNSHGLTYELDVQGNIWGEKERKDIVALKIERVAKV